MTTTVFEDVLREKVEEKIGERFSIGIRRVPKNNGVTKTALEISENNSRQAALVYIDDMYDEHLGEEQVNKLAADVANICQRQMFAPVMDIVESISDWKEAKEKLVMRVINAEWNEKMLEDVPHINFLDLAVIYCVNIKMGDHSAASAVNNKMLSYWEVSKEVLHETALQNMKRLYPECCKSLGEMIGVSDESICPLQVWTNTLGTYGASVMAYGTRVEELAEKTGKDLYVLPSSVHELLILPKDGHDAKELLQMVRSINRMEVEREEWLSDNIYCYSRADKNYIIIR